MGSSRRDFLKTSAVLAGAAAAFSALPAMAQRANEAGAAPVGQPETTKEGDMLYRKLGRSGVKVSIIGVGGAHLGWMNGDAATRLVRRAVDSGINFMDNCWDYSNGECEKKMGAALKEGYREKVFLMTKIDGRDKATAARQIDECLQRLQTDHVDLMQHHEVIRMEDPDRIFKAGGAQEAMLEAQKAGKIKYIGFTGHKDPLVHLRMLEIAAKHNFKFDACQMPLNVLDGSFRSFEQQVVPVLVREGIGVLGMKSMGGGIILRSNAVKAIECLHYAMSLPTSVVIAGMDSDERLTQALEAVKTFQPLTAEQKKELLARTAKAATDGEFELYKTTPRFDGTARNPQWLGRDA